MGGFTKVESKLQFTGIPDKTFTYHSRATTESIDVTIEETFIYDEQKRLTKHEHKVNNLAPEILAEHTYNEINQLSVKKVGGNGTALQTVDYRYNIRGWLTGINSNDIVLNQAQDAYSLSGGKLFGYRIKYNDPASTIFAAKYNGNIAEVDWINNNSSLKRYNYDYDKLNRLLNAVYQDPGTTNPQSNIHNESIEYDLNGNIKKLYRNAKHGKSYTAIQIDNLTYTYDLGNGYSNRLRSITDGSQNLSGYEGGGGTITYDANGNMKTMPDKGITTDIFYNYLNLPTQIKQNTNTTNYYYRADGAKIKKKYTLINSSGTNVINTEYLDGFQYSTPNTEPIRLALQQTDDATVNASKAGEEEAFSEDLERQLVVVDPGNPPVDPNAMILSFFPTAEGYYDYENLRYIYQYKDHLGNVRISYTQGSAGVLKVLDTNEYYPFGMNFLKGGLVTVYDPMAIPYNYKYNGKELQETGMYALDWRQYMPDIARFGVQDPLSAILPTWTPYRFAFNNPVYFSDPTGLFEETNALAHCPTCPDTPEFQDYINDPNEVYVYNSETNTASLKVTPIEEVVVTGKKSESNTTTYLGFLNDNIGETGDWLAKNNKGGTVGVWTTPIKNRNFDGITYNKLNVKYYGNNWQGNQYVKVKGVGNFLKKGSLVGQVVLGAIEIGEGAVDDYNDYQTKGETNGKNTVVASSKVATGVAMGYITGVGTAWATSALAGAAAGSVAPGVGTVIGFVIGAYVGYKASEYVGSKVEEVYK